MIAKRDSAGCVPSCNWVAFRHPAGTLCYVVAPIPELQLGSIFVLLFRSENS